VPPDYNDRKTKSRDRVDRLYRKSYGISHYFEITRNRAYLYRTTYAYTSNDVSSFGGKFGELALAVEYLIQSLTVIREFGV
jgi:hypothetical protein